MKRIRFISLLVFLSISTIFPDYPKEKANWFLRTLYQKSWGTALRFVATKPWVSCMAGWYANSKISRLHIASFVKTHNIPMKEAQPADIDAYATFNDFFSRKLKPGARTIEPNPTSIVSPADGVVSVVEHIGPNTSFAVKDKPFDLKTFLNNQELAHHFQGGTMVIVYLRPWDYHRFHAPCNATIVDSYGISGKYESVNPIAYEAGIQPLTENERRCMVLTSSVGKIAMLPVGALMVGSITETVQKNKPLKKGDEMGYFSFGGSTVVLLFEKNKIAIDKKFLKGPVDIKMGQVIGKMI